MNNTLLDNSANYRMVDFLRQIISDPACSHLRIATGYWDLPGTKLVYAELKSFLERGGRLDLMIGEEPTIRSYQLDEERIESDKKFPDFYIQRDVFKLTDEYQQVAALILQYCNGNPANEDESQIRIRIYGQGDEKQFLHAKCYIGLGAGYATGIIGSSNFTQKGLEDNAELNYLETANNIVTSPMTEYSNSKSHNVWFEEKWELSEPWNGKFINDILKKAPVAKDIPQTHAVAPLTPYELYIKLLQERFGDLVDKELGQVIESYLPVCEEKNIHYNAYEYQIDAVKQCFSTMREYGGFILADVVGLGKTVVGTLLIRHFIQTPDEDGRERKVLIVTPPAIQSAWKRTIADFDTASDLKIGDYVEFITTGSVGHLVDDPDADDIDTGEFDALLTYNNYGLIIVDESHKFRNSETDMYHALDNLIAEIGSETGAYPYIGLLSATPQNNRPDDLKNQIYLFTRNRTSSKLKKAKGGNIESYFAEINREYKNLLRKKSNSYDGEQFKDDEVLSPAERRARLIALSERLRADILDYVMVRRTRTDVRKYYYEDMQKQGMVFPEISGPNPLTYTMSPSLAQLFYDTMAKIAPSESEKFDPNYISYYRYRAISYLKDAEIKRRYDARGSRDADKLAEQLAKIMQNLLVKRLESSFSAFLESLNNLKHYTNNMIRMWENNTIFICPDLNVNNELDFRAKTVKRKAKVTFQDCIEDIRRHIARLDAEGRNEEQSNCEYTREAFDPRYIDLIKEDYEIISDLCERWGKNSEDPKLDEFKDKLLPVLFNPETNRPQKLVIFSEAIDTVDAVIKAAEGKGFAGKVLRITAANRDAMEDTIAANFDANYKGTWRDDYQIIVTTDVLAEGINLHRANVILNYDTPWNATKLMQRIGRVNRIGSREEYVYVYNFMPSAEGDHHIDLVNKAYTKLQSFHTLFGEDSQIFSDSEEVAHYDLNTTVNGEESPLEKYIYELKEYKTAHPERYVEIEQATEGLQLATSEDGIGYFIVKAPRMVDFYVSVNPHDEEGDVISLPDMLQVFKSQPDTAAIALPSNWEAMQQEAVRVVVAELAVVRQRQGNSMRATSAKEIIIQLKRNQAMSPESKKMLNTADALIRKGNPDMVNSILVLGEAVKKQNMLIPYTQEEFDEFLARSIAKLVEHVQLRNGKPEIKLALYKA